MGIKTLLKNLRYLSRYNLKELKGDIQYLENHINFLKYELKDDIPNLYIPEILSVKESAQYILKEGKSLVRFGDGEFKIMAGSVAVFQKKNEQLSKRLNEIFDSKDENIIMGIPYSCCHSFNSLMASGDKISRRFLYDFWGKNTDWILNRVQKDRVYIEAGIFSHEDIKDSCEIMRNLWRDKDITIISGDRVFKDIKHNVFDCAKSIEYINAPTVDAFEKYDEILKEAKKIDKNRIVCIILGPTATVLAYDLAQEGYQALDLGHIVKAYDLFKASGGRNIFSDNEIQKFYGKD